MKRIHLPPRLEAFISGLPFKQKLMIYVGTLVGAVLVFVLVLIAPKYKKYGELKIEIEEAQQGLCKVKNKANNLARFKSELLATRAEFQKALAFLPDQKEIPGLLTSISNLGNQSGLEFVLFKPKDEVQKDFYAEIPVEIIVVGPYHNVVLFFDKVSRLPRIVSISGVNIIDPKMLHGSMVVRTSCTATTYRFTGIKAESEKDKKEENKTEKDKKV